MAAYQRMREQGVDAFLVAVDDVEHALRQAGFGQQLAEPHGRERHLLRRLQDERVAAGERDREHPQRHHEREIERRDADADADRMADGFGVDVGGDVLQRSGP